MEGTPTRYARVTRKKREENPECPEAAYAAYLPDNYRVLDLLANDVLIAGEDYEGWTLDGYVLPRLASGLRFGEEITPDRVKELMQADVRLLGV